MEQPNGTHGRSAGAAAFRDPERVPMPLSADLVMEILGHARECYPEECCGVLLGAAGGSPRQAVRLTNVQSLRHSRGESELDAGHGFWMDETELLATLRDAERRGQELMAVYHSHIDTEAYLSHADLAGALSPDGRPLYPGAAQIVVSVWEGVAREMSWFEWDEGSATFVGRAVQRVTT
jgi:proteasome lid subunit RPN8/RPN11